MDMCEGTQAAESLGHPVGRLQRLSAMNGLVLAWFREHARVLPWREDPSPYRVWISEIMLQQTRVESVKPYFARFLRELPDVIALASASEERLLKLWEGLGYYSRARNLRKAAEIIVRRYGGRIPDSRRELESLPGIGSYTAGAIASIAYGKAEPAVDGNVLRVVSRVLASQDDISSGAVRKQFERDLAITMPKDHCGAFNQGLFEIGALVCVPNGKPECGKCPLSSLCLAGQGGLTDLIPHKSPKKPRKIQERTILLITSGDQIAIQKRPKDGLLASLYEFPGLDGFCDEPGIRRLLTSDGRTKVLRISQAGTAVHVFSHVEWHMKGFLVETDRIPEGYLAARKWEIKEKYPLPSAFDKYRKLINEES